MASASVPDYTYGATLYECFSKYLLKPNDYILHGHPLELPGKPGCAYIDKRSFYRQNTVEPIKDGFHKCIKCSRQYEVDEKTGMPLSKNDCHHHWGNLMAPRQGSLFIRGSKIYSCCKLQVGSTPCHTAEYHVTETESDDCLEGFVRLPPYPTKANPNAAGIYSLDCEMCFTTRGKAIVRASLLSVDNTVIDMLIKPKDPVLNYITQYTGLTEEKLALVTTTLEDVQKILMKELNDKTILVGHSIACDLKALKLIHSNVVDTSVLFPHKNGLPNKSSLKFLCDRHLGKKIQLGEHDSLEDARACLQLVLHQVRKDSWSRNVKQLI